MSTTMTTESVAAIAVPRFSADRPSFGGMTAASRSPACAQISALRNPTTGTVFTRNAFVLDPL